MRWYLPYTTSENGEVTIKVEKPSVVEDTDKNNIESQVKMLVINNKTKENICVGIQMYHVSIRASQITMTESSKLFISWKVKSPEFWPNQPKRLRKGFLQSEPFFISTFASYKRTHV